MLRNKRSHRNEKPAHRNKDPMQPKIKNELKKKDTKKLNMKGLKKKKMGKVQVVDPGGLQAEHE